MPHINGIELIREVRRQFDKATLPIVMVTTQNETQDNDAAHRGRRQCDSSQAVYRR
jgi:CheY-like chemotaxis protein